MFEFAETFGALSGQKPDDMQRQQSAAHHGKAQRVAIVVDSAADLPEDVQESLGIHVVPIRLHFGNRAYLDKVTMTPTEFYRELATNPDYLKTSQPPPGDFRRMYEFLASHFEAVVSISLSARVSGTYNAAAAQRIAPDATGCRPVNVVDSLSISAGQGLIAIAAAERAAHGARAEEVIAAARDASRRTRAFAPMSSVDYPVKGGRVPRFARIVANLLNLSIVLATQRDGRVKLSGAIWGRRNMSGPFARFVIKRLPPDSSYADGARRGMPQSVPRYRIMVGHGDALDGARSLAQQLGNRLPAGAIEHTYRTDMGTALGVHGGPGTLIVGVQRV